MAMMQPRLIPDSLTKKKKGKKTQYAVDPGNSGPARLVIPDWYAADPPTEAEIEEQIQVRDQALQDWQEAGRRYTEQHPPLPIKWSNWPEAKEYDRIKKEALRTYEEDLYQAREKTARMNCLASLAKRPFPPGSPSAVAFKELKERLSQRPPLLTDELSE